MYNGEIIYDLLKERNLLARDLWKHLHVQSQSSIVSLVRGNPNANRLEQIADFFDVPIDILFQRGKSYYALPHQASTVDGLEKIIEEKDKRIALLEDMISLLKEQQNLLLKKT